MRSCSQKLSFSDCNGSVDGIFHARSERLNERDSSYLLTHTATSIPCGRIPLPSTHPTIRAANTLSNSTLRTSSNDGCDLALQAWCEIPCHRHPTNKVSFEAALIVVAIAARLALQLIQNIVVLNKQVKRPSQEVLSALIPLLVVCEVVHGSRAHQQSPIIVRPHVIRDICAVIVDIRIIPDV